MRASSGIGMPWSSDEDGVSSGCAEYGRYDFVRRVVKSMSMNEEHSIGSQTPLNYPVREAVAK